MSKVELEAEVTQLLVKKYKQFEKSCHEFIKKAIKIEDRDVKGLSVPFKLWPDQENALETFLNERLVIVMKARQLGLTWLALAYSLWRMVFQPGYSIVALSKREEPDAKELIRRLKFMLKHLPSWLIQEKGKACPGWNGPVWETTVMSVTITHPGDEPSVFQSMTAAPDSGRSFTANLIILDEWAHQVWAKEIWDAGYPAVNRPTGGQVLGISTNKRGSFFEFTYREAMRGVNNFKRVFLGWFADPRRDQKWYNDTKQDLPDSIYQEYPASEEEAFSAGEGTAFPEFSRSIHVCKPFEIPTYWRRWRANDPGYSDPYFWLWFAVSEDGIVYVYREFTRDPKDPRFTYSEQAKQVTKISKMLDEGQMVEEKYSFTVTGRDAFNKDPETGKSIIDYYKQGGVRSCIPPPRGKNTDRIHRKATLHEYLKPYDDENKGKKTAKLQIFENCHTLIETLPLLVKDKNDPEKVADTSIDHGYDCLGMGLVAWHSKYSKKPDNKKEGVIARHKKKLARMRVRRVLS